MEIKKFSVLIAEDEKLIANNIANNIARLNPHFEVVGIASNGQQAYDLSHKIIPDVLFSDIKMPVMDGLTLISKINDTLPKIRTVIISGYDDFNLMRCALQQRAIDYLLKPVNYDELEQLLQRIERELLAERKILMGQRTIDSEELAESIHIYIKHNYNSFIDFSEIADRFGFTQSYLTKIFKKYMEVTPARYLKEYRISVAKKLLMSSNLSIKEIADQVGFDDPFHFSKSFKDVVGESPNQFRKQK